MLLSPAMVFIARRASRPPPLRPCTRVYRHPPAHNLPVPEPERLLFSPQTRTLCVRACVCLSLFPSWPAAGATRHNRERRRIRCYRPATHRIVQPHIVQPHRAPQRFAGCKDAGAAGMRALPETVLKTYNHVGGGVGSAAHTCTTQGGRHPVRPTRSGVGTCW